MRAEELISEIKDGQILIKQLKEKLNCEYLIFTKLLTEEQIKNYHEAARNGIEYDDGNDDDNDDGNKNDSDSNSDGNADLLNR